MSLSIPVIYGSVRQARQGIRVARYLMKKLQERNHRPRLIDPLEHPLPLVDRVSYEYESETEMPDALRRLSALFRDADAFVLVTAEYNHSVPPALKNILDHFHGEFFFKPCGIACYSKGMFGGIRAAEHLRLIMSELGSPGIRSMFVAPKVQQAFDDDGSPLDDVYEKKVKKFLDELEWYGYALKEARRKGVPF